MDSKMSPVNHQRGVMLIESLMAILIFALGIMGLVGIKAFAAGTQSDAQYRAEANRLATEIVNYMWFNVNRADSVTLTNSLNTFRHRADAPAANCGDGTAGTPATNAGVLAWRDKIAAGGAGGLPGATNQMQRIEVNTGLGNQVTVTVCWRAPQDTAVRRHVVVSSIN